MELREYKRLANALKMQDSNKYSTWDNIMQLCLNMYEDTIPYIINAVLKTEDNEVLARAVEKGQASRSSRFNPSPAY